MRLVLMAARTGTVSEAVTGDEHDCPDDGTHHQEQCDDQPEHASIIARIGLEIDSQLSQSGLVTTISARRLATLLETSDDHDGPGPLYRRLAERIRLLVVDGRISDLTRLPSERDLAETLRVSRTTTTRAYAELRDLGLLTSRRGSGSVVHLPLARNGTSSLIVDPHDTGTIALTYAAPAGAPGIARAFESAVARLPGLLSTSGYLPDGLPELRRALADRYARRGLPTDPEQIIVTNGAMGAIALVARTFLTPGRRTVVEAVSYPYAHDALREAGARLAALPVGDSLWDPEALSALLGGGPHQAAYVIPEFHNPTGQVMSGAEREAWAGLLRRHGVLPIVDESLCEVNLDDVDLPPPYAVYDDRALLIGSVSKEFWGGFRVGWIRAPRDAVNVLIQRRMSSDLGSSAFDQLVLAELLDGDHQPASAGRTRARDARDHLLGRLAAQLPSFTAPRPGGGLSLWVRLPRPVSTDLTAAAAAHSLLLTPGPRFVATSATVGERHLRLPFAADVDVLTDAVNRLAHAWTDLDGGSIRRDEPRRGGTLDLIA